MVFKYFFRVVTAQFQNLPNMIRMYVQFTLSAALSTKNKKGAEAPFKSYNHKLNVVWRRLKDPEGLFRQHIS